MKTTVLHHRVPDEDIATLDKLADGMISRQQAATIVLRRAISYLRDNPEKFRLLPHFDLPATSATMMNDTPPPYKTKPKK